MASLSYEPATDREMYPGTIPMNAAASRPAEGVDISLVKLEAKTVNQSATNSGTSKLTDTSKSL